MVPFLSKQAQKTIIMYAIDWYLIVMKQVLYATHQHSEKRKKKYTVKLLLVLYTSLNLRYNKKTYETYDSNKSKESQKNVVKHIAYIFPPDVFLVLC